MRVSISEEVAALSAVGGSTGSYARTKPNHPAGWEAGVRFERGEQTITSGPVPVDGSVVWDEELRRWGFDPAEVEVVEPARVSAWEGQAKGGGTVTLRAFKGQVRRRSIGSAIDVDILCDEIRRHKPAKRQPPTGTTAFVVCVADWQIGKPDGDGTAGTVRRVLAGIDAVTARIRELRRLGRPLGSLYVVGLGDIIESCDGHYDMQAFGVELNLTEQVRVARRLIVKALTTWAPLFEQVVVPVVPGNHGENRRGGKAFTDFADNHDVAVFEQAAAVLEANPDTYGHVSFVFPTGQDLTVTLDIAGTVTALAHGHQFRGGSKAQAWWASQAHGMQPPGDATLLLSGHYHHLRVEQSGAKTWLQAPALDGGSTWWVNQTGQESPPGILTMTVGGGGWADLAVL